MKHFITISALLVAIALVGVKAEELTNEDREICAEFARNNGLTVSQVLKTNEECKVNCRWSNGQGIVLNSIDDQQCDGNKEEYHHCCKGDCIGGLEGCDLSPN
ncbi:hypothetical protein CPB97_001494 [Podila verticillata]|nr:hypothetical protein CPB97_001494 [Podila verticillata]